MSYVYDALDDIPAAFYLFDDSASATPDLDLYSIPINSTYPSTPTSYITDMSGYNRYASSTFDATSTMFPMLSGATSGIKLSNGDQIMYPPIPIWGGNQNNYEFTVEFWLYDYGVTDSCTIFAPTDSDGQLIDVGIFYNNGKITFRVGDATGLLAPENYISVSHQLVDKDRSHHVVCVYGKTGVSISVDGGIYFEKEEQLVTQNIWTHSLTGFITDIPDEKGIAIAGMAIYQSRLQDSSVYSHYISGTDHFLFNDISNSSGGSGFILNDEYAIKTADYYNPMDNGTWVTIEEDNLLNDAGRLTLKEIEPGQLNDDLPVFSSGSLELQSEQYLVVNSFYNHSGKAEGGVSGSFYFDTAKHDNSNEYCILSVSSGDDTMSILKDSSGDIVLRHRYIDEDTYDEVTVDSIYGALAYDEWLSVALFWSYGVFTLYCNDFLSPIQYQDSSSKQFSMSQAETMTVGSLGGDLPGLESNVKNINIYDSIPKDLSNLDTLIETTTNYSLKLTDDTTNVYQAGYAKIYIDTSGIDSCSQIRLNYGPVSDNILLYASIDDENYYLLENNRPPISFLNGDVLSDTTDSIFIRADLKTQDSFFDVTYLKYISFSSFSESSSYSNQSLAVAQPNGDFYTGNDDKGIMSKYDNNGVSLVSNGVNSGYIEISGIEENEQVADDGRPLPAGNQQIVNTVELFIKQNEQEPVTTFDYINYDSGAFAFSWSGTELEISGFDNCFINKQALDTGMSLGLGEWNHILLTLPSGSGESRTNEWVNPKFEIDTTGISDGSETSGSRVTNPDINSTGYVYEMECSGTSTTGYGFETDPSLVSVSPADDVVASVMLMALNNERLATISLVFYDVALTELSSVSETYSDFLNVSLFAIKATAPASTEHVSLRIIYESGIPDLEIHYASNILIEKSSKLYTYFDGDSEDLAYWEGTEGQSRSIYPLGLSIDSNSIFIGTNSSQTEFATECSYKNIMLHPTSFDINDAVKQYNLHAMKSTVSITDGGVTIPGEIYSLPFEISPIYEDGHPKIEDIDPLAVATSWTIHSS